EKEVPIAPKLGLVAVVDPRELDDVPRLEGARRDDLGGITLQLSADVTHQKTTAGRENLVRRVRNRLDHQLTLQTVHVAHTADDDVVVGQASAAFSETGTALALSVRPRRVSWRALRTPARRSSERTVSDGCAPLSSQKLARSVSRFTALLPWRGWY